MLTALAVALVSEGRSQTQVEEASVLTTLRLEMRADFRGLSDGDNNDDYGFQGRYFNLHAGGRLGDKVSYYFRQRINANEGDIKFFDNTDFLWVDYRPNAHWRLRLGKDAMAIGGFEYDAAPIDVMMEGLYWDNFYCFQIGALASYTTDDGRNMFAFEVANSPYVNAGGYDAISGLLAYNLLWVGNYNHLQTRWSASVFNREDAWMGMLYTALGTRVAYDRWDWYVDLIHYLQDDVDMGEDYAVVSRLAVHPNDNWTVYAKGIYEQSVSDGAWRGINCLFPPRCKHVTVGLGAEYKPERCPNLRFHCFVAEQQLHYLETYASDGVTRVQSEHTTHGLEFNVGVTWNINFLRMLRNRR